MSNVIASDPSYPQEPVATLGAGTDQIVRPAVDSTAKRPTTLVEAIRDWARHAPDREPLIFLVSDGAPRAVTYGELHRDATRYARALAAKGILPGELVILVFQHGYELVATFLGAMHAGAIPTIFPYLTARSSATVYQGRVQEMVRQTSPRAVLTASSLSDQWRRVLNDVGCPVITLGHGNHDRPKDGPVAHSARPEDPAYIQFSSGTTDCPKGVVLSHRAVLNNIAAVSRGFPFGPKDVNVGWLPLFHDLGLITQLLLPLVVGGKSVMMAPDRWVRRPTLLFRALHDYRGTMSWMPNFAFAHCVRHVRDQDMDGLDLSSWHTLGCGGEPVQFDTLRRFANRFTHYGFDQRALMPAYGLAENVMGVTQTPLFAGLRPDWVSQFALQAAGKAVPVPPDTANATVFLSCGVPFDGARIAVVDQCDKSLPERCVGEIVVGGNALFSGYYRQPDRTAQSIREGWFHTGDLGYLAYGHLYVCDRKKDIIIGGRNIHPHSIEAIARDAFADHGSRAAAFGIRDAALGTELPVVVVEVRGRRPESELEELTAQVRQQVWEKLDLTLADIRVVKRGWIEVTTSGKVARKTSRQKYLQCGFEPHPAASSDGTCSEVSPDQLEQWLVDQIARGLGLGQIDPHGDLFEMGLDSLGLLQILMAVEAKTGKRVCTERLVLNPTVQHLVELLYEPNHAPSISRPSASRSLAQRNHRTDTRTGIHARIYDRLVDVGPVFRGRTLPYSLGHWLSRQWLSQPWVRATIFRQETALVLRCLKTMQLPSDPKTVVLQSLMANTWRASREQALRNPPTFERWVTVRGAATLEQMARDGRGVVVAFVHSGLRRLINLVDVIRNRETVLVGDVGSQLLARSGLSHLAEVVQREAVPLTAKTTAQLYSARQTLTHGGIALILADGGAGNGGAEVPFHGRRRLFRPGAAELSLSTGAALVVATASLDLSGHVTITFSDPLLPESGSHLDRIDSLTRQYASIVEAWWTSDLGSVGWNSLRLFLSCPAMESHHPENHVGHTIGPTSCVRVSRSTN